MCGLYHVIVADHYPAPDGARPALHERGATNGFTIDNTQIDRLLATRILHIGGVGQMNRMDDAGRTEEVMAEAKRRGIITTLDVYASTAADLPKVARLLPYTDYVLPSEEAARALSGLHDYADLAGFLLNQGVGCLILTLGAKGAYYSHSAGTTFHTPAFQVEVKCTCGSGDCFQRRLCNRPAQRAFGTGSGAVGASLFGAECNWSGLAGRCARLCHDVGLHRQDARRGAS